MDESLKNKVAFVTGAATGIGKETALLLAKNGVKTMIADINEVEGRATTKTINDSGGIACFYKLADNHPRIFRLKNQQLLP